ncbi:hypothetical protein ATK36_3208 [Amycolatopsis sulphurea]|uniref:Uncharacterized protein n=1 Tax=Amycolatopsis sulphurea TaxID=76022 RepID=A0A2A9F9V8_9PSEU|nr:hypothetical protein [Amycolatopsis sulphurea]PFG48134.1 hypothetical protein ATK36_3208 [Amycolatopsis sulphurea]
MHDKSDGHMIPALDRAGRIAWPDLFLSLGTIVVLVVLGFSAPSRIHPLFYFGLRCRQSRCGGL